MTLEEKCAYLSGKNAWDTRSFTSIGIDVLHHADGPTGVRKQAGKGDHLGLNASVPATCFPTAATLANRKCVQYRLTPAILLTSPISRWVLPVSIA